MLNPASVGFEQISQLGPTIPAQENGPFGNLLGLPNLPSKPRIARPLTHGPQRLPLCYRRRVDQETWKLAENSSWFFFFREIAAGHTALPPMVGSWCILNISSPITLRYITTNQ